MTEEERRKIIEVVDKLRITSHNNLAEMWQAESHLTSEQRYRFHCALLGVLSAEIDNVTWENAVQFAVKEFERLEAQRERIARKSTLSPEGPSILQ